MSALNLNATMRLPFCVFAVPLSGCHRRLPPVLRYVPSISIVPPAEIRRSEALVNTEGSCVPILVLSIRMNARMVRHEVCLWE